MRRQIAVISLILIFSFKVAENSLMEPLDVEDKVEEEVEEWDIMIQALIVVESEGNPLAVGSSNDVGVLQITPIYVAEVNRILGENLYTLEHRISIEKSLEMFEIYQAHHNPSKDILKARKIHNPRAGQWYIDKVMEQFNR